MSYMLKTTDVDNAEGQLKTSYDLLTNMFEMVPKVFVARASARTC